jgi:Tfp pilus assembly protein PilF
MISLKKTYYNVGHRATSHPRLGWRAIAEFREAIRLHPGYLNVHQCLADGVQDQNDLSSATLEYQTVLRHQQSHTATLLNLGATLHTKADLKPASNSTGPW